jgi:hypothetical protein
LHLEKLNKSALPKNKSAMKQNKSAMKCNLRKITQVSENSIFANHPGWVTHLCTFALWQQLSVVLVNRHFFLNQSQNEK